CGGRRPYPPLNLFFRCPAVGGRGGCISRYPPIAPSGRAGTVLFTPAPPGGCGLDSRRGSLFIRPRKEENDVRNLLAASVCLLALAPARALAPAGWADFVYSSVILADNPVGYWRLGEPPAQTTAFDSSPFGRNGTYNGAVTRGVPGAIVDDPNTAAAFSGGFVSIPGGPFNFANNFSLEAWVINNNATAIGRII